MFTCIQHGWSSAGQPCPACVTTVSDTTTHREQAGEREAPLTPFGEQLKADTWKEAQADLANVIAHYIEGFSVSKIVTSIEAHNAAQLTAAASRHEAELVEAVNSAVNAVAYFFDTHKGTILKSEPICEVLIGRIKATLPADIRQRVADNAVAHDLKVKQDFAERVIAVARRHSGTHVHKHWAEERYGVSDSCGTCAGDIANEIDHIRQLASEQGKEGGE